MSYRLDPVDPEGNNAVAAVIEEESNRVRCQEQIVKSLYRSVHGTRESDNPFICQQYKLESSN
jgi:hypothetical protein